MDMEDAKSQFLARWESKYKDLLAECFNETIAEANAEASSKIIEESFNMFNEVFKDSFLKEEHYELCKNNLKQALLSAKPTAAYDDKMDFYVLFFIDDYVNNIKVLKG
jgi:glucan phosphorylase